MRLDRRRKPGRIPRREWIDRGAIDTPDSAAVSTPPREQIERFLLEPILQRSADEAMLLIFEITHLRAVAAAARTLIGEHDGRFPTAAGTELRDAVAELDSRYHILQNNLRATAR